MHKYIILFIIIVSSYVCKAQQVIYTEPRQLYNYALYTTDTNVNVTQLGLPRGAMVMLHPYINNVAHSELLPMQYNADTCIRFWYRNNTILTKVTVTITSDNNISTTATIWPNAELIVINKNLLECGKYKIVINNGKEQLAASYFIVSKD